jgi:signal transduction histidine kinase/streptogramin lyase
MRFVHNPSDHDSLSHNYVTAISEGPSGLLWVGTRGGGINKLVISDGYDVEFTNYRHQPDIAESLSSDDVSAIYQDQEDVLWIGTRDAGINRMDPEKETFTHYRNIPGDVHSLSSNYILSIHQDREGVFWFGTLASGINKLEVEKWQFPHYKNEPNNPRSLGNDMVRALYQAPDGNLWIGTMFGGIDSFDRETGEWHHFLHDPDDPGSLSDNWTSVIFMDSSGVLWIGTRDGLDKFDPDTETFTHYQPYPTAPPESDSNNVRVIYEDQTGEFWVGTYDGLNRFNRNKEIWTHSYQHDPSDPRSLGYGWMMNIYEDLNNDLWIGTSRGGLNRFDREQETFIQYQNKPDDARSLSHNLVMSILPDQEGGLWIGTAGGLDRFDPETETFAHYREKDGLPNEKIYCMVEDRQGHLWLSSNKGLSMFNPQTETFTNYDVTDGLQSNEFNACVCNLSGGGEIFFGGVNGFNAFFPESIHNNPIIPPIFLTSFTHDGRNLVSNTNIENMTEITQKWPDNAFEFEYAALSFAQPEKNQYAYYLEGFEETWNEVGTRRNGQYTNLPGGTYTLRVKGSNNDGVWNEVGTAVKITIVPPFWQTSWFIGTTILALAGLVYGGYRLRIRNLETRGRELETQVDSRTKELSALNEVASVVSHSLDLDQVLKNALSKTLEVVGIEAGGIYLLEDDKQTLNIVVQKGLNPQLVAEIDNLKVGEGFSGQVAQNGELLIVKDLSEDARLTRSVIKDSGFHSLAIAPLVSRGQVLGTLFVITSGVREFSQQDVELIVSIGGQIGVAVENSRLYERAQLVAVVEERQRMARELHDSVTQSLYSLTLFSEAARHQAEEQGAKSIEQQINQIGVIGTQALKEMRLMVYELQPPELERDGLIRALRRRLEAVEGRAGVDARVEVDDIVSLPGRVEQEFFRIAQEGLNNALKHAAASSVGVYLRQDKGQVEMEIVDDGVGFDPGLIQDSAGLGLMSIQERVKLLGGKVTIDSEPGEGTRIRVTLVNPDNTKDQVSQEEGEANE